MFIPPLPPPSSLSISPPLRILNKQQLDNGRPWKLKRIFGTTEPVEETQKTEIMWPQCRLWSLITQEGKSAGNTESVFPGITRELAPILSLYKKNLSSHKICLPRKNKISFLPFPHVIKNNKTSKPGDYVPGFCAPPSPHVLELGAYQKNVNNDATFPIDLAVYKQSFSF